MGKIKRGILGGFQGKVGTVIGTRWKGINVIRAVPENVRDARTIKQLGQRMRFRLISELMKKARPFIRMGFEVASSANFSASNAALAYNIKYAITGEYPNIEVDLAEVRFAMGSLLGADGAQATSDTPSEISFNWGNNSGRANATANDQAMLIVYSEKQNEVFFDLSAGNREDSATTLTLPESWSGETVHAWIAFHAQDKPISSTSTYIGTIEVA